MTWTLLDNQRASRRGWAIFNNTSIERIVTDAKFPCDKTAREHVLTRAYQGDRLSRRAIKHIVTNQPLP